MCAMFFLDTIKIVCRVSSSHSIECVAIKSKESLCIFAEATAKNNSMFNVRYSRDVSPRFFASVAGNRSCCLLLPVSTRNGKDQRKIRNKNSFTVCNLWLASRCIEIEMKLKYSRASVWIKCCYRYS